MTSQVTGPAPASAPPPQSEPPTTHRSLLAELTMPLVLAAFATYLLVGMLSMSVPESVDFPGPRFFPAVVTAVIYALVIVEVLSILRHRSAARAPEGHPTTSAGSSAPASPAVDDAAPSVDDPGYEFVGADEPATPRFSWRSFAWVVGGFLVFALLLEFLGWIIGAAVLFWCVARGFGSARPLFSLVVGLTVSSLAYIAFDMALGLSLPSGLLGGGF
ncbi:tripartite tricarboxylate transporter TctB family protein [Kocuria marina]|uniref:tripartite tricarboxylate transporter TctB family protein n=1 Tax=Kocuria marina TaxID=223184 RepID=UPI0021A2756B|nr:tripartite tricarboxylate transporter TctB family protein [Kocuria marina]